jgi:hypothetical protein
MPGVYGGLIVILIYAGIDNASQAFNLITQSNTDILTQASENILVQVA